ncbi:MAG TPA: arsenate reductase ArsC [Candidatus Limiplasma sp.]|nr:arsenate reductase ArsC [Candidatus Limiplasma sp.]HPR78365.1 arsenate reductase ArsC [Candidatus Limiplasma sp.]
MQTLPKVAFVCTHNSCRSQMAEALGRLFAADVFISYSAGTHPADQINPDAVRVIRQLYGVELQTQQRPKLLAELPAIDVLITMGCGVECPFLPCRYREDWDLSDPTGQPDEAFTQTAHTIEAKVHALAERIQGGLLA